MGLGACVPSVELFIVALKFPFVGNIRHNLLVRPRSLEFVGSLVEGVLCCTPIPTLTLQVPCLVAASFGALQLSLRDYGPRLWVPRLLQRVPMLLGAEAMRRVTHRLQASTSLQV
jgi:hypothetical protein